MLEYLLIMYIVICITFLIALARDLSNKQSGAMLMILLISSGTSYFIYVLIHLLKD